jgi:hypothetical protein
MQDNTNLVPPAAKRIPWNKGQLIGAQSAAPTKARLGNSHYAAD